MSSKRIAHVRQKAATGACRAVRNRYSEQEAMMHDGGQAAGHAHVTRRAAIGAAAVGAAALALGGCAKKQEEKSAEPEWDGGWLPIGSAVKLKVGMPSEVFVVVSRKPKCSKQGNDFDYAFIKAVFGITRDYETDEGGYASEFLLCNADQIEEVLSVGYIDANERRAWGLLDSAKEGETANEALVPIAADMLEEARAAKSGD